MHMKLTVFQSDKGDCLLVTSKKKWRMLVDGGMGTAYRKHVAPALGALESSGEKLDLVYVSHIDEDHIQGVLYLMDDLMAWRVFDYQKKKGNPKAKQPKVPRPPAPAGIWHNAFRDQVGDNAGAIADLLAARAQTLLGSSQAAHHALAAEVQQLATSMYQALQLSRRIAGGQLGIPLNKEFDGKLAMIRAGLKPLQRGGMKIYVIGPFEEDLAILRKKWNAWAQTTEAKKRIAKLKMKSEAEEQLLHASEVDALLSPLFAKAGELGNRKEVTPENLASLMLYVEEGKTKVLLTGDGHASEILRGLRFHGKLQDGQGLHVDVLKVQHHGSEHNTNEEFTRTITADHYVFCGNGAHENPDERVVQLFHDSRLGSAEQRSKNPQTDQPFKMWFNSNSGVKDKNADPAHMRKLEKRVDAMKKKSGGKMSYFFLKASSFDLDL
jgi:beta-lactamase superfamily II metal-dependent hydrolase